MIGKVIDHIDKNHSDYVGLLAIGVIGLLYIAGYHLALIV